MTNVINRVIENILRWRACLVNRIYTGNSKNMHSANEVGGRQTWRTILGREEQRASAEANARNALAWLIEHSLTPTPESFEVAFNYVIAQHGELRRNIESVLQNGGKLDDYIVTILLQRFFRSPKVESAIVSAGEELSRKLDSASQMLEESARDQAALEAELGSAAKQMGTARRDGAAFEIVVRRVLDSMQQVKERSRALEEKLHNSAKEVKQLREQFEGTRRENLTDPLTGVANRRAFDSELQREIDGAIEEDEPLSLIVCDIDRFSTFNAQWGPEIGDQVLRAVATAISKNVKGRDITARLGGDRFAVIVPKTGLAEATIIADHLRTDVAAKRLVRKSTGAELSRVTISAGVAEYGLPDSPSDILRRADACLNAAKEAGRNRVVSESQGERVASSAHAA